MYLFILKYLDCIKIVNFRHYNSLALERQTVLTNFLKYSMISCSLILVYRLIMELAIAAFHQNIQGFLLTLPNLTCSLLSLEPLIVLFFYNVYVILFFKVMVALYPVQYLSMDHDCVSKMILMLMLTMWSFEYLLLAIIYGTYCHNVQIHFLKQLYSFKFDEANLNTKPSIVLVHIALILIPQIIKFIAKTKHRKGNQVHPTKASLTKNKVPFNDVEKGNNPPTDVNELVHERNDKENFNRQLNCGPNNVVRRDLDDENTTVVRYKPKFAVIYVDHSKSIYISPKYRGGSKISESGPSSNNLDNSSENKNEEKIEVEDYIADCFCPTIDNFKDDNSKMELESKENKEAKDNTVKDIDVKMIKLTTQCSSDIPIVDPQIIRTDSFVWYCTICTIVICVIVLVKIDKSHLPVNRIGHVGWLLIPPFWIIRTEEILNYVQRRYLSS